ncbi:MAG: hypothetical protein QG665_320, partial [Patescibacteria group bacterium]|nr:hypothetical protein [Patescibacteria group bacterium]
FFFFHYGAFMAGHLVFIWFMVQKYDPVTSFNWYGFLFLIFNLVSLFVSHGISYQQNFIKGKEYERAGIFLLFGAPYRRIAVMHLVVLLGSMLISGWGWPLYIVVIIKLVADYWAHINAHKVKFQTEMIEKVFDQFEKESNLGSITKINNQDVPAILNDKLKR